MGRGAGLLSKGTPLSWNDSLKWVAHVRAHGIIQFINTYNTFRHREGDTFRWGDEVESIIVYVDKEKKHVRLQLRAAELLEQANKLVADKLSRAIAEGNHSILLANFLPEFGRFMIESTPNNPYGGFSSDLRAVERNMRLRRQLIESCLTSNERLMTITNFPLLGAGDFTHPTYPTGGPVTLSAYVPDQIIGAHPRFATLTRNIRERRGEKVNIRIPLFQDSKTRGCTNVYTKIMSDGKEEKVVRTPVVEQDIHMDAMPFGMGCCCLQVTFQTRSVDEARHLYDHLAVLAPIMLSLSAATPFVRGHVSDYDVRWATISQSVDDRTPRERGMANTHIGDGRCSTPCLPATPRLTPTLSGGSTTSSSSLLSSIPLLSSSSIGASIDGDNVPLTLPPPINMDTKSTAIPITAPAAAAAVPSVTTSSTGVTGAAGRQWGRDQTLGKSRYDSISAYIARDDMFKEKYNDIDIPIDQTSFDTLRAAGIDAQLARHVAHLWTRDPLVIYDESVDQDDLKQTDHFENLQSTNWQTVRFKPPPHGAPIGWRVEFRSMEVQLTDFENAAFSVFIALCTRAILYFNLNFYIPLSKVDVNMQRAHHANSVINERFFFRSNMKCCGESGDATVNNDDYEEMTIQQILCGKGTPSFPGLIPLVRTYLDLIKCDLKTRSMVDRYLVLLEGRASGALMTQATWLRKYVSIHPSYGNDSILNETVVYDLMETMNQISQGKLEVPQLLGNLCNLHHSKLPPLHGAPPMVSSLSTDSNNDTRILSSSISSNDTLTTTTAVLSSSSSEQDIGPYLEGASHSLSLNTRDCSAFKEFLDSHLHAHNTIIAATSAATSLS